MILVQEWTEIEQKNKQHIVKWQDDSTNPSLKLLGFILCEKQFV